MHDYLDADCVLTALFDKGVLTRKLWKLTRGTINSYTVTFELKDSARIVGFNIYIKGTYHCIGLTAFSNRLRVLNTALDAIIAQCRILS